MTDDERRGVAKHLRAAIGNTNGLSNGGFVDLVEEIVFGGDVSSDEEFFARLADLIEPEERTCERGIEMFSHAYPNEIVCDSDCVSTYVFPLTCGHEVELLENKWPSYCPHCGARVVADD